MTCVLTIAATVTAIELRGEKTMLTVTFKQQAVKGEAQPDGYLFAQCYGNYAQSAAGLQPGAKVVLTGRLQMLKSANPEDKAVTGMMDVKQMIAIPGSVKAAATPTAPPAAPPVAPPPAPTATNGSVPPAPPVAVAAGNADDIPF